MKFFEGYNVLRLRDYRLFWMGQWVSLVGTWMQGVTQAWLLMRLTESPMMLGLLGAASSAPLLVLVLLGGLVSDRFDRRRVVIVTQVLSLLQALALAILTLGGWVQPWHIIALAGALGAINAFDVPARQAYVMQLVGPAQLPNAIALNSTGFNAARVVGPAVGGLLVAAVGEGLCFLLNALSYVAVLISLLLIHTRPGAAMGKGGLGGVAAVAAGLRYARLQSDVARILVLVGVVSAIAVPYRSFLPDMARTILDVGAWRFGLLMAAAGLGAGAGGLVLAGLTISQATYRRLLPAALVLFSLALAAFSVSASYVLSLGLLTLVGVGGIVYFNCSNTLIQLDTEDLYRGRVMSLYALMHQGTATFGSLGIGVIADRYGTPAGLIAGAAVCLAAAGAWVATDRPRGAQ